MTGFIFVQTVQILFECPQKLPAYYAIVVVVAVVAFGFFT